MEQLNKVELRGVVGSCREIGVGDRTLVRFSLATTHAYKNKEGEPVIETSWHYCQKLLTERETAPEKGDTVSLVGRLRYNRSFRENGQTVSEAEIIVHEMKIFPKDESVEPEVEGSRPATSETLYERLAEDARKVLMDTRNAILNLLKANGLTSVNVGPYVREEAIDNYYFFDTDRHGNGEALELRAVRVNDKGEVELEFDTNYGDYFGENRLNCLTVTEALYVLEMLEGIIAYSKQEGVPVLKEGEDFEEED